MLFPVVKGICDGIPKLLNKITLNRIIADIGESGTPGHATRRHGTDWREVKLDDHHPDETNPNWSPFSDRDRKGRDHFDIP